MEQSEKSEQDMEIDFRGIEERDESLYKIASEGYYKKPDMVRFLMAENLALKLTLLDKGIITPEEHKKSVKKAKEFLDAEVKRQIEEWRKQNPKEMSIVDTFTRRENARNKSDDGN